MPCFRSTPKSPPRAFKYAAPGLQVPSIQAPKPLAPRYRVAAALVLLALGTTVAAAEPLGLDPQALLTPPPNIIRACCAFGADLSVARIPFVHKSDLISVDDIGRHRYLGDKLEGNGIIYTRRGGFVDLGHLRDYVDWTAYLHARMAAAQAADQPVILELGSEGGHRTLTIDLASHADRPDLPELAGKIAFDLSLWHEIATWFGASYIPFVPERYSSFSPEDLYSNLLGVEIGMEAIRSDLPFEEAVSQILMRYLTELGAVPRFEDTYFALEQVEDVWWTRRRALPNAKVLLRRNIGAAGELEPWLVPDDELLGAAYTLALPREELNDYYCLSIRTNAKIGLRKILPECGSENIDQTDFPLIIDYIASNQIPAEAPPKRKAGREWRQF